MEIKKLIKSLLGNSEDERIRAAYELSVLAEEGTDIEEAVELLIKALEENTIIKNHAAAALAFHYMNKKQIEKIRELFAKDDEIKIALINCLEVLAYKKDISDLAPDLEKMLKENNKVREKAAGALTVFFAKMGQWKKIEQFLKNTDPYIRFRSVVEFRALPQIVDIDMAIPFLEKMLEDRDLKILEEVTRVLINYYKISSNMDKINNLKLNKSPIVRKVANELAS